MNYENYSVIYFEKNGNPVRTGAHLSRILLPFAQKMDNLPITNLYPLSPKESPSLGY